MGLSNPVDTHRRVATGSYVGNGGDDRQIAVGFKCCLVIVVLNTQRNAMIIPGIAVRIESCNALTGGTALHASDGFTVYETTDLMNFATSTYYYFALAAD